MEQRRSELESRQSDLASQMASVTAFQARSDELNAKVEPIAKQVEQLYVNVHYNLRSTHPCQPRHRHVVELDERRGSLKGRRTRRGQDLETVTFAGALYGAGAPASRLVVLVDIKSRNLWPITSE